LLLDIAKGRGAATLGYKRAPGPGYQKYLLQATSLL
jgi:hypothetical protein